MTTDDNALLIFAGFSKTPHGPEPRELYLFSRRLMDAWQYGTWFIQGLPPPLTGPLDENYIHLPISRELWNDLGDNRKHLAPQIADAVIAAVGDVAPSAELLAWIEDRLTTLKEYSTPGQS